MSASPSPISTEPLCRSNKSGNVPVNEYVQLAAELRSCMAFEPKRWRKVLDKSSAVLLPSSGCRPQLDAASTKKRRQLSAIRPSSRDEDTESVVLPHVHALSHRHVPTSLAAYLSQPAMVRAILDEASAELDDTSTSYEQQGTSERTQRAIDATSDGLDALPLGTQTYPTSAAASPQSVPVRLPLLTAMTPRTCQQLARLPAPQADDIAAIDAMEQMASSAELARNFYRMLQRQQQRSRVTGKTQHDAQRRVATVRSKHALPRARVTKHRSQTNAAASPDKSKHHTTMRDEQACMAMEDVDAVATVAARPTPDATTQCSGVSDARQQLLHEQASAAIATQTAETHVAETLAAIQHLLPLELIYAFGKGAFASPAQQRAAHVLARVTTRLRFRRVATAMAQWQRVVADIVAQEQDAAALCLQCAWRQTRAVRERTARERIRRELRRRQEALLRLLASKQNASASVLTRALRRYAHRCAHERQIRATLAATHIQKFWRERQALWVALRIQLRKQQRQRAAVCIQRHVRGRLARRRRRLLEKIQHVDAMRQRKQQLALERQHTIERTGAVLLIQRTVRKWRQRRVLALRRRRAQFERDKRAIVKVQAQYRSRKAQRWFVSHVLAVHRAVRTLQRAWRCYVARCTLASLVQARDTQRRVWRDEIAERRRKQHSSNRAVVKQHVKKTWGQLTALKDRVTNTGATGATGPSPREVQAAKQLQAYWRGLRTRKRLRHERARQRELARRAVNRSRRLAATCIQRRVRGIQGRALAWRRMVHRSAMRIQSAWRGVRTRRQLVRTKRALLAITRMQQQWRARRSADALRQRQRAASTIQTRARVFLGRRWLQRMVRRQQFLSEEHAMGKALLAATRRRVQDELLLQSFVYKDIAFPSASDDSESDTTRVDRSLFRANRTRRGYDGVWQEVFRSATGGAREIDNARFVRFLKALPHAFVHKTSFPTHTIDVVFAKMKEPKARTLSFARFTAAMLVVWRDKFGANGDDHTRFLRFMRDFVLPSTLQRGKFRSLLDAHCAQRMLWAVHILRRFAARIATRKCHDAFVVAHAQQQVLRHRERCARVIETSYGRYRFRQQLRALLAQMFIEFVDHTGHAVRYEHVLTHRVITGTRPRLLHGVACARVVPLPFPGEEFHAFCERHEDSSCQSARVPADLYCVVCEDAMCHVCFRRDHAKRAALAQHETRAIRVCSHCRTETATRECLHCGNGHVPFCDACFPHVHTAAASSNPNDATGVQATPLDAHAFHALVVMCIECASRVAQWRCETCADVFCKRCLTTTHARGQRQHHACARLSYFSVLKQTAEDARRASASKAQAQMNKERAAARAERARELALRHASATKIQALVRSFVARQHGRAYMKLVRQTHAAKAQRLKDERTRSSLVYKVQHAFGVSPALKSDTAQETAARRQRIDAIKATLFLHRRVLRRTTDGDGTGPSAFTHEKRRWSKRARARVQRAAHTWCVYGVRVKIVRGAWRNSVGSILSTQHVLTTGYIVVFVALANRAVVVAYDHVAPFDDDEILRQAYEAPSRVVADAAHDAHATVSRVLEGLVRKAQLLYLQTIAYHDIAPLAWVVEYNRVLQRPEFWNVVLNKRTLEAPRAMELIERMDEGERQVLDARVAAARAKLLALLHPFTPKDMPALTRRRPACAFLPLKRSKRVEVVDVSAQDATWSNDAHVRAVSCARLWHETIAPSDALGGARVTSKFLRACATPPHSTRACWRVVELWQWMELYDSDGYEAHAKAFFRLSADAQLYVADDIAAAVDGGNLSDARAKLLQLLKLKDETLQLLVFNQAQQRAAAEDAVAAAAEATAS